MIPQQEAFHELAHQKAHHWRFPASPNLSVRPKIRQIPGLLPKGDKGGQDSRNLAEPRNCRNTMGKEKARSRRFLSHAGPIAFYPQTVRPLPGACTVPEVCMVPAAGNAAEILP